MKINTEPLESFVALTSNPLFIKKKVTFNARDPKKAFTIQPHNMICTCELRIRETSQYLNCLQIRKQNESVHFRLIGNGRVFVYYFLYAVILFQLAGKPM